MDIGNWIGLFTILASTYILWQIRQLLLLVFTAMVIATTLNKLCRKLQSFRIKRSLAVLISVSLFILLIITFFWVIVPPLAEQFEQLITIVSEGINKLNDWLNILKDQLPNRLREQLPNIDINEVIPQLQPILNQLINNAAKWKFMFGGQQKSPIIIRLIVGRGWGQGPTHSQNFQNMLANVPGLKIFIPSLPSTMRDILNSSMRSHIFFIIGSLKFF